MQFLKICWGLHSPQRLRVVFAQTTFKSNLLDPGKHLTILICDHVTCRVLRDFWAETLIMYKAGQLPLDFFSRHGPWLQRGNGYRTLVEPLDIAVYYRRRLWQGHPAGEKHYLESDNRPAIYEFLEKIWVQQHEPDYPCTNSTESAQIAACKVQNAGL